MNTMKDERHVQPRAWMVKKLLSSGGYAPPYHEWRLTFGPLTTEPARALYDQAQLNAAVTAVRARCIEAVMWELDSNGQAKAIEMKIRAEKDML